MPSCTTRTGAPTAPRAPNTRDAAAWCTSRAVTAGAATTRPPSSPNALISVASIACLLVATHARGVARSCTGSDGPQVAHVDLVRPVARDRLHERQVAHVRVQVDVGHAVRVARAAQRVHAQVAGVALERHVVARIADHRRARVAIARRAAARGDDLLPAAYVLVADLAVPAARRLVGDDPALDVVVGRIAAAR